MGSAPYIPIEVIDLDSDNDGIIGTPDMIAFGNALGSVKGDPQYERQFDADFDNNIDDDDSTIMEDMWLLSTNLGTIRDAIKTTTFQELVWPDDWNAWIVALSENKVVDFSGRDSYSPSGWISIHRHFYELGLYSCSHFAQDTMLGSYKGMGHGCLVFANSSGHGYNMFWIGGDWTNLNNWRILEPQNGNIYNAVGQTGIYKTLQIIFYGGKETHGYVNYRLNVDTPNETVTIGAFGDSWSSFSLLEEPEPPAHTFDRELGFGFSGDTLFGTATLAGIGALTAIGTVVTGEVVHYGSATLGGIGTLSAIGIVEGLGEEVETEILRPNASGDKTQCDAHGGSNWQCVDEVSADGDDTYVSHDSGTTSWRYDLYHLPAPSGSGVINFVKLYTRLRVVGNGNNVYYGPLLKSCGVEDAYTVGDQKSYWHTISHQWDINPGNFEPWSWVDIGALQIGVKMRGSGSIYYVKPRCTQVYVEVNYTRITHAGVVSLSGAGSLIASAVKTLVGKATLTGSSSFSAIGKRICYGIAAIIGVGTLDTSGTITAIGKAVLSGAGSLSTLGKLFLGGKVVLSGTGNLVAKGVRTFIGKATLLGTGSLVAKGIRIFAGIASLTGSGLLSAIGCRIYAGKVTLTGTGYLSGHFIGTIIGIVALSGSGSLSTIGRLVAIGKATLSGAGVLTTVGRRIFAGKSTLLGTGTLITIGSIIRLLYGVATLTGQGTLFAIGSCLRCGKVSLSGMGNLASIGCLIGAGKAILVGVGTLKAIGILKGGRVLVRLRLKASRMPLFRYIARR